MIPALLLIDLQFDYLERGPLTPSRETLLERCEVLIAGCRRLGLPVLHSHTVIRADDDNRMPHWKRTGYWACVEGTRGCESPESLRPVAGEQVFRKSHYNAFQDPALGHALKRHGVDVLITAGLYLHACVQTTVLEAYQRGYQVWVAADAVASGEARHLEAARDFLKGRAADFIPSGDILARLVEQRLPGNG